MTVTPEYNVIVPDFLWVGSHPARAGRLDLVLAGLHQRGVRALITLTEKPLDTLALEKAGLLSLHLPVENYGAPSRDQLDEGSAFIDASPTRGGPTLAHCFAGIGRAGTLAAAYLIHRGASVDDAIEELRQKRHSSCVESAAQRAALDDYARSVG